MVDADNRLRGSLRFHAAHTGRWSGRGYQPQNLKRPDFKAWCCRRRRTVRRYWALVRELGAPLTIAGDISTQRHLRTATGHKLIAGDFSAVESRVLAWLANEKWKLETYRRYDETGNSKLPEPYCVMASQALKRIVTPEDEAGRQFGKTYDLASALVAGAALGANSIPPTPIQMPKLKTSNVNSVRPTAQPCGFGVRSSVPPTAACAARNSTRSTIDFASTWNRAPCS